MLINGRRVEKGRPIFLTIFEQWLLCCDERCVTMNVRFDLTYLTKKNFLIDNCIIIIHGINDDFNSRICFKWKCTDSNMILDLINSGINPREIEICA